MKLSSQLIILGLLLTACQPQAALPTPTVPPPTSTTVAPIDLTPAQVAALGKLSDALSLPMAQIAIVQTEAVEWGNGCLGISLPQQGCTDATVPGFKIILEANQVRYEYRTNQDGRQVKGATLALTWHRVGGFAGFCDDVQIYLSGEVWGSSCKTGAVYPVGQLTVDEMKQLANWARTFGTVTVQTKDPAVTDAMTVELKFSGQGSATATEADQTALFNFAQTVYGAVKACC